MRKIVIAVIAGLSWLLPFASHASPGFTDRNGCHVCNNNCDSRYHLKEGEYHCHVGEDRTKNYTYAQMQKMGSSSNSASRRSVTVKSSSSKSYTTAVQRARTGRRPRK